MQSVAEVTPGPWYQAAFGAHYPLLYSHRDEAEARLCLALLARLAPMDSAAGPILDLGCGDGRHLQWLAAEDLPVMGLDLSAHLLARAAEYLMAEKVPLIRGDMRSLPVVGDCFGTVLSLFTAFGYFGTPAENTRPVAEVARVLRPGGHWFLDYFDGQKVLAELGDGQSHQRERELDCLFIRETRRYQSQTRQVVKDVLLTALPGCETEAAKCGVGEQGLAYTEQVAVFTIAELDEMARAQGMVRVAAAGDYNGTPLGEGSRWILVYRKEQTQTA